MKNNVEAKIKGAEIIGEAARFDDTPRVSNKFWQGAFIACVFGVIFWALVLATCVARANMIVELQGVADNEFMISGVLTNDSDEEFNYRIGAQAYVASGYAFQWVEGFNDQFHSLLPGESMAFDWAWLWHVEDRPSYSAWLELQAYDGTTMVMSQRASITWTDIMAPSVMVLPAPDIQGASIRAVTVPEPATIWLLAIGLFGAYIAMKNGQPHKGS